MNDGEGDIGDILVGHAPVIGCRNDATQIRHLPGLGEEVSLFTP
jgi:hypothetical protein